MLSFERADHGARAHWSKHLIPALLLLVCSACLVAPPRTRLDAEQGTVRADRRERAATVAAALDDLAPRVRALLPGTRTRPLEVWVQDVPALYAFQTSAYSDADGFFAEGMNRVHLRDASEHIERTLAHELVHASLDGAWERLPGTIEEGLCDVVSAELRPEAALALATGRLSSAAFATGGLVLDLELSLADPDAPREFEVGWSSRLRLDAEPRVRVDPLRVFDLQAGLSTSRLNAAEKRSFYGVAFLVVRRIVARVGYDGLYALCTSAEARGLAEVPTDELLAAAGLTRDPASLRAAILESLGPAEVGELVRAHPEFLVGTIARFLEPEFVEAQIEAQPARRDAAPLPRGNVDEDALWARLRARVRLSGSRGGFHDLGGLEGLRPRVAAASGRPAWTTAALRP